MRIGIKQSVETRNVAASSNRTFWAPTRAIPTPLTAGPSSMPMLPVLCISALAAVSWGRSTINGTDEDSAGPNTADTTDSRNTSV